MSLHLDEDFWEDLLAFIEEGKVIPVIGQGVVTFGPEDEPFYPWIAGRLAERLSIPPSELDEPPTLNRVATAFHLRGKDQPNVLYTRFFRTLKEECPEPGPLLRALAQVGAFKLFLSTTVDPLLENALNSERYGGEPCTEAVSYSEGLDRNDLPARMRDLNGPLVYHLFGKASVQPEFVLWEADMLETVIDLHDQLKRTGTVDNLSRDLKEHGLLLLGLSFSDWLVRLFLRITQQEKLSLRVHPAYLADSPDKMLPSDMVMFFGAVTRSVHVVRCCPKEFTRELARRWLLKHPRDTMPPPAPLKPMPKEMPRGAVFVSYAREDEDAVRRLIGGLQEAGCTVWYDRERLKPGAYWPSELEDEVKSRCGLFVSVVSRTTESSPEGYYHRERNWAAERYNGFSQGHAADEFYIPVVIDESPLATQNEPRVFASVQCTRLKNGAATDEFARHVHALQQKRQQHLAAS